MTESRALMNNIPDGWKKYRLEEIAEIHDELRKPVNSKERNTRIENKNVELLYPYYGATGKVGLIDDYLSDGEYVLVGEDGAPFLNPFANKAYIISGKAWVNNHAHVLKAKGDNKFLCHYLNYFNYQSFVSGTTRLKLTQNALRKIPVFVPSFPEQQRIVAKIEELFSKLDAGIESLKKAKQQLAVYRQAVLKEAFVQKESKIVTLAEITDEIKIGPFGTMLHKEDYISDGIPVINPQHIKNGQIIPSSKISISSKKCQELASYKVKTNDVIMGRRGEMGRCAAITKKEDGWLCGTGSILFRLKSDFDACVYAKILSSPDIVHYLEKNATGTTMKNLNEEIVKNIPVPFITKQEQSSIVRNIESRLSVCDQIKRVVNESLEKADVLRQSILKKAFEGGL